MIRVLIADDHASSAPGSRRCSATPSDIEVVGTAADGARPSTLAERTQPDVVLMDLSMPDIDGIEATRAVAAPRAPTRTSSS